VLTVAGSIDPLAGCHPAPGAALVTKLDDLMLSATGPAAFWTRTGCDRNPRTDLGPDRRMR
jgi:hypothetical protein